MSTGVSVHWLYVYDFSVCVITGLSPSDVGLNGVLSDFPVWHFLAVSLGVPVIQVEAYRYDPLGGLLALQYWRDGRCEASYPSTWLFFLEKVRDTFGKKVAEDLEKKASKDPTWSQ